MNNIRSPSCPTVFSVTLLLQKAKTFCLGLRLPLALLQFLISLPSLRVTVGCLSSRSWTKSLRSGTGESRRNLRPPAPCGGETPFPSSRNVQPWCGISRKQKQRILYNWSTVCSSAVKGMAREAEVRSDSRALDHARALGFC